MLLAFEIGNDGKAVDAVHTIDDIEDLRSQVTALLPATGRMLVVIGPTVGPAEVIDDVADVHRADPGAYCTSVWLALAENYSRWTDMYSVIALYERDSLSGIGYLAVLRD